MTAENYRMIYVDWTAVFFPLAMFVSPIIYAAAGPWVVRACSRASFVPAPSASLSRSHPSSSFRILWIRT